jgi:hypothetical protein
MLKTSIKDKLVLRFSSACFEPHLCHVIDTSFSQRMIVEMGDYAWSEHIVTVFLACQITIKNVQVQLTVKGKTIPDSYTPIPKSSWTLLTEKVTNAIQNVKILTN